MQFDRHTLVLLVLRPDAPERTEDEAAELQDRHLAFRADLRDRGFLIGGGPLVDQDDERLRGISIMACDPETARRLSNEDPAVQAGRLAVEVMTWMVPAGNVRFESVSAPRSLAEAAEDQDHASGSTRRVPRPSGYARCARSARQRFAVTCSDAVPRTTPTA